jgi:hypothetical protein
LWLGFKQFGLRTWEAEQFDQQRFYLIVAYVLFDKLLSGGVIHKITVYPPA